MVKEQNYGYSFSPFRFVLIHPLRFAPLRVQRRTG